MVIGVSRICSTVTLETKAPATASPSTARSGRSDRSCGSSEGAAWRSRAGVGEHRQRLAPGLVTVLKPEARTSQASRPSSPAMQRLPRKNSCFRSQDRQDRRAPVGGGAAGDAHDGAGPAHRGDVVAVAQVDQPVGHLAPDGGLALVDVLLGGAAPTSGSTKGICTASSRPGSTCVRVGEHDELALRLPDPDAERRALAVVLEHQHPQPRVVQRRSAPAHSTSATSTTAISSSGPAPARCPGTGAGSRTSTARGTREPPRRWWSGSR